MNRKIILLPLVLSALVLAGCGETGTSSTSSSEKTPTSSETTSSSEEVPSSSSTTESETSNPEEETWSTIADLKTMDIGASFTARAYWMGTCGMINEQFGTYNTSYVADGAEGYIIYRGEASKIDALELEVGKTVVEFTGTIANYVDEDTGSTTYECSLNTIAVVDDATGLEAPVMLTLNAANPTFTFDATTASRRVVINDAKVVSNETGNYDNVTVTFTVGTDDTKYTIYFDSRYTDTSLVADLKAGDTFSCESFVGRSRFESIDKLVITSEGGSTEEPDPEPEPLPTPVDTTIAEALTGELSKTTLYKVTGVIEAMEGDDYGNAMLVDPETGDYITVYGNTTTMSAFTVTDGEVSYTNPKDAKTTLADIHDGDKITVLCVYDYFEWTDTHELLCVTTEHATYDGTVAVTMPIEIANATATASKTEAAWGEDITITVTPSENFAVTSVKVDHGYTTETLTAAPYTFKARCINNVNYELRNTSVVSESLTIVADNVPATYNDEQTFTVDGVVFKSNNLAGSYGNGIQTKIDAFIYNETALPKAIDNIVFTFSEKQTSTTSADSVNFGTSVMTEVGEENNLVMFDGETATITVDCDVESATFFRIDHTLKGAIYLESIVINYAA